MRVELLLPLCQGAAADELCPEVAGERVHDDDAHLDLLCLNHLSDLIGEEHLVV